ncbi:hypothetical protein DPM19_31105 [Actinomadura craniellae]|uniref:Uncharacterized protein n=1 Tax=Actinomadura craniellae TaxID=2231787 RepID=A0A365GWL0_9ACTN|nr:hypothetical protein DPM19_31105 [Actinomadura craniellae]
MRKHAAPAGEPGEDAEIYAAVNGWSVVLWPVYFFGVGAATRNLATEIGGLAGAVFVHDDDYWLHALTRGGEVIDRSCSVPEAMFEYLEPPGWCAGDPAALAAAVGADPEVVGRYLAVGEERNRKAHPDDDHELWECRVFIDFWRRLGITWPARASDPAATVPMAAGWTKDLPFGDPWTVG